MKYRAGTAMFLIYNDETHSPSSYEICVGKRNDPNKLGYGMYSLPGGKVDDGEEAKPAAIREVLEETGIVLKEEEVFELTFTTELVTTDGSGDKYITMYYYAFVDHKNAINTEPHKCQGWEWHKLYGESSEFGYYVRPKFDQDFFDDGKQVIKFLQDYLGW